MCNLIFTNLYYQIMLKYIQTIIQHYGLFKKSLHQSIGNKILHQIGSSYLCNNHSDNESNYI